MFEIERKFLVKSTSFKEGSARKMTIKQGFLNLDPQRTVRVRIKGGDAYLTVKGITDEQGVKRFEWETKIAVEEAETLLELCDGGYLEKTRFEVPVSGHIYEVDEFHGQNEGLLVAEIELEEVDESFEKPEWLGEEVTGDNRYYNSQLIKQPLSLIHI